MEEMKKNVKDAFEAEQNLCNALGEYVGSYDIDEGRAKTLLTKC